MGRTITTVEPRLTVVVDAATVEPCRTPAAVAALTRPRRVLAAGAIVAVPSRAPDARVAVAGLRRRRRVSPTRRGCPRVADPASGGVDPAIHWADLVADGRNQPLPPWTRPATKESVRGGKERRWWWSPANAFLRPRGLLAAARATTRRGRGARRGSGAGL